MHNLRFAFDKIARIFHSVLKVNNIESHAHVKYRFKRFAMTDLKSSDCIEIFSLLVFVTMHCVLIKLKLLILTVCFLFWYTRF